MNVSALVHRLGQFVAPLSSVSSSCENSSKTYINGIAQDLPWALAMSDASAKPQAGLLQGNVNSLGYFEECIDINSQENISAQHCVAVLNMDNANNGSAVEKLLATKGVYWGICLPSTCSSSDVKTGLNDWMKDWKVEASRVDCQESFSPMDAIDWFAVSVLMVLGLFILLSTGYDKYLWYKRRDSEKGTKEILCTSFSILENGSFLCKEASDGEMRCLNGVRFLSILWILFGHIIFVMTGLPAMNAFEITKMTSSWRVMPIIGATLAVDTFLLLSGLLAANKFLKVVPRQASLKNVTLSAIPIIIHRYLRIAPAVAILILLQVSLWRHAGSGPLWVGNNGYLVEFCKENWFWALLFVQNYVSGNRMCFGHSWYLNVDMQLFLLSPLVITPLLYWRERICILMFSCLVFSGFVISFLVNYLYEFPPGLMAGDSTKWAAKNQYYYVVTHTRFAPYVIGIAVGYLIHKHKDTEILFPIFKKGVQILLWLLAAAALLYSVFGVFPFQSPDYVYSPFTASVFTAALPIIWALGVGWFILACELNQCPFLSRLLGTSRLHALSKLTYCIYLVHLPIMSMRAATKRVPVYVNTSDMFVDFFGDCALSILFAVVLHLGVEAPFTKFGYIFSGWLFERLDVLLTVSPAAGGGSSAVIVETPVMFAKEDSPVAASPSGSAATGPSTSLAEVVVHKEAEEESSPSRSTEEQERTLTVTL